MKALSTKQPYASLIADGIKDIENRSWKTNFRGRIFIHASACWHVRIKNSFNGPLFTDEQIEFIKNSEYSEKYGNDMYKLTMSAIIGEVDIVDCAINHPSIWAEKSQGIWVGSTFVHKEEHPVTWNWVLANAVMYDKPILNIKGKLSFWEYNCCHICKQPVEPDWECRDCGELVCDKCSEPYNQFTQIDYTLCKTHRDG